ncbi:hypothetical protein C824_000524 [Schaedlerella arabinosiphila]|nr:hypothetical protein C824_000524 [Schaedlerella arabinosiphila]
MEDNDKHNENTKEKNDGQKVLFVTRRNDV